MIRYFPGSLFGTTPIGEILNMGKGGEENGPASQPFGSSSSIFLVITSWCRGVEGGFLWELIKGPWNGIWKPWEKPSIRVFAISGL